MASDASFSLRSARGDFSDLATQSLDLRSGYVAGFRIALAKSCEIWSGGRQISGISLAPEWTQTRTDLVRGYLYCIWNQDSRTQTEPLSN